jgi:hypothetical protein
MTPRADETPEAIQADVHGLLNVLAHYWHLANYQSARPAADALMTLRERQLSEGTELLDPGILARIRYIRGAASHQDQEG